jgi:hypothetical protein
MGCGEDGQRDAVGGEVIAACAGDAKLPEHARRGNATERLASTPGDATAPPTPGTLVGHVANRTVQVCCTGDSGADTKAIEWEVYDAALTPVIHGAWAPCRSGQAWQNVALTIGVHLTYNAQCLRGRWRLDLTSACTCRVGHSSSRPAWTSSSVVLQFHSRVRRDGHWRGALPGHSEEREKPPRRSPGTHGGQATFHDHNPLAPDKDRDFCHFFCLPSHVACTRSGGAAPPQPRRRGETAADQAVHEALPPGCRGTAARS